MFTLIITLTIIASILLILVVLAQNSKGGGLSSQFGGSGASQVMGVKKTGDFLEKLTWGLAVAIFLLAISSSVMVPNKVNADGGIISPNVEKAQQRTVLPSLDQLGGGDNELAPSEEEGSDLEELNIEE
jgi:preprotein translocase subunit SecG